MLILESEPECIRRADELATEAVPRKAYSLGSERGKSLLAFFLFFFEVLHFRPRLACRRHSTSERSFLYRFFPHHMVSVNQYAAGTG